MKKVLITGFTGQVGSLLADYLLENTTYDVYGMMRWQESLVNISHLTDRINRRDRVFVRYADLTDYSSLDSLISSVRPDYIFHLAAQSFPRTSFDIPIETLHTNIVGTCSLLEVVKKHKLSTSYDPVVHVCSSSEVYGKAELGQSLDEDTKFHGASPYSISKIGTDYLGQFYGEAYGLKTFVTRMGTHSGPRRSDVFFESTVAKQIALIEAGYQEPFINVGNLNSVRTYQDARDAVRAYHLLAEKSAVGGVRPGDYFNIAGEEAFRLTQVIDILTGFSNVQNISIRTDENRLRPIDADYQMFDNSKIKSIIEWKPIISARQMFLDLLNNWRDQIRSGHIPLNR